MAHPKSSYPTTLLHLVDISRETGEERGLGYSPLPEGICVASAATLLGCASGHGRDCEKRSQLGRLMQTLTLTFKKKISILQVLKMTSMSSLQNRCKFEMFQMDSCVDENT